jgi:hypothetical protein
MTVPIEPEKVGELFALIAIGLLWHHWQVLPANGSSRAIRSASSRAWLSFRSFAQPWPVRGKLSRPALCVPQLPNCVLCEATQSESCRPPFSAFRESPLETNLEMDTSLDPYFSERSPIMTHSFGDRHLVASLDARPAPRLTARSRRDENCRR